MELHVSTQANNTNYGTYLFWHQLGAKRVVSARELSLEEIKEIRAQYSGGYGDRELYPRSYVHSYSGRCLLSNFFTGRDANQGACTQSMPLENIRLWRRPDRENICLFMKSERGTVYL
mgnify:CR=1 FL=1